MIVNADAMQVYDMLRGADRATDAAEMQARAASALRHGVARRAVLDRGLVAAVDEFIDYPSDGRPLIFVGGTGLYFDALQMALPICREVPAEVTAGGGCRDRWARPRGAGAADRGARSGDGGAAQIAGSAAGDPGAGGLKATGRSLAASRRRRRQGCWTGSMSSAWCSIPTARCCASGSPALRHDVQQGGGAGGEGAAALELDPACRR